MKHFHIISKGNQSGPFPESEVQSMLENGTLAMNDMCWAEGMTDWMPIHEVIVRQTNVPPPPPPHPTPAVNGILASFRNLKQTTKKKVAYTGGLSLVVLAGLLFVGIFFDGGQKVISYRPKGQEPLVNPTMWEVMVKFEGKEQTVQFPGEEPYYHSQDKKLMTITEDDNMLSLFVMEEGETTALYKDGSMMVRIRHAQPERLQEIR